MILFGCRCSSLVLVFYKERERKKIIKEKKEEAFCAKKGGEQRWWQQQRVRNYCCGVEVQQYKEKEILMKSTGIVTIGGQPSRNSQQFFIHSLRFCEVARRKKKNEIK